MAYVLICCQVDPRPVHPQLAPVFWYGKPGHWANSCYDRSWLPKSPVSAAKSQAPGNRTALSIKGLLGQSHRSYRPQAIKSLHSTQLPKWSLWLSGWPSYNDLLFRPNLFLGQIGWWNTIGYLPSIGTTWSSNTILGQLWKLSCSRNSDA